MHTIPALRFVKRESELGTQSPGSMYCRRTMFISGQGQILFSSYVIPYDYCTRWVLVTMLIFRRWGCILLDRSGSKLEGVCTCRGLGKGVSGSGLSLEGGGHVARCLSLLLCSWACCLTYCLVSSIELYASGALICVCGCYGSRVNTSRFILVMRDLPDLSLSSSFLAWLESKTVF